jgi:hypothetical protein
MLAAPALFVGCGRTLPVPVDLFDDAGDASEPPRDGAPDVAVQNDAADAHPPEASFDAGPETGLPPNVSLLSGDQLFPQGIALSAHDVFWTNGGELDDAGIALPATGSVASTPRSGGATMTLAAGLDEPLSIAYEEVGHVLAFSVAGTTPAEGSVFELDDDTGVLFPLAPTVASPYGVAVDPMNAYWVSNLGPTAQVQTSPLGAADASTLGVAYDYTFPSGIAINGESVFFAALNMLGGGALFQAPLGGGAPEQVWEGTGKPFGVALDSSNVYWVDHDVGAVYQMPLGGGHVVTLAQGLEHPFFVAVDSLSVYFATNIAGGAVYEASIGGGRMVELATGLPYPAVVAADDDDDFVYFTLLSGIARVQKQ